MSNRVCTFDLSCFSLRTTFSNLATDFWRPVYSTPREDLIAKPGELPTFSLTILIAQKPVGTKIQSGPDLSGLLHWREIQFLQMPFHLSVIWRSAVDRSEP